MQRQIYIYVSSCIVLIRNGGALRPAQLQGEWSYCHFFMAAHNLSECILVADKSC